MTIEPVRRPGGASTIWIMTTLVEPILSMNVPDTGVVAQPVRRVITTVTATAILARIWQSLMAFGWSVMSMSSLPSVAIISIESLAEVRDELPAVCDLGHVARHGDYLVDGVPAVIGAHPPS